MLKGIGQTSIKQMNQDCKIYNFEELLSFDVEKYNFENKQKLKSQIEKLKEMVKHKIKNQDRPKPINHMNTDNPYKSKYGNDWEKKLHLWIK